MKELTFYITKGLQGSGKSTEAKKLVAKGVVEVNRDDIRKTLPGWKRGKFNRVVESEAVKIRDKMLNDALSAGQSVVSSDTNLGTSNIDHFIRMAKKYGATVEILDFTDRDSPYYVSVEDCIKRDLLRDDSVGKDVILKAWYTYVMKPDTIDPMVLEFLPTAFIFDIDGTLAHTAGKRQPYDENYEVDELDFGVFTILNALREAGHEIIIFSGREGSATGEQQTLNWLSKHGIVYREFHMRACGDKRNDALIKKELYENKVKFRYNILGVFDDRKRVCRQWEELGLKVFRCGPEYDFDLVR